MKLSEAWETYFEYSGRASDVTRKLAFSGIALIWIFSGGNIGNAAQIHIRGRFTGPLVLMVMVLALDFLQYAYLTLASRTFAHSAEMRLKDKHPTDYLEQSVDYPPYISKGGEVFFFLKLLVAAIGYSWLLWTLAHLVL